jgi:hypothetical protein
MELQFHGDRTMKSMSIMAIDHKYIYIHAL